MTLYIKKKNGRYIEFEKFAGNPNLLYFLKDGNYIPIDETTMTWYNGRPACGVWVVSHNKMSMIGDYDVSDRYIQLQKIKPILENAIQKAIEEIETNKDGLSISDMAKKIIKQIEIDEKEKLK